jgi:hypothetical protein
MEDGLLHDVAKKFSARLPVSRKYLEFCRKEIKKIFPKAWDSGTYGRECRHWNPKLSATVDSPRSEGGAIGAGIDHDWFLQASLKGIDVPVSPPRARLNVVQAAGKPRALTQFPTESLVLGPLHKTIYSHLSNQEWLLRGPVTDKSLEKFRKDAGIIVSGDYSSATDGLSIEVAEVILSGLLSRSIEVPREIREYAIKTLRPRLFSLDHGIEEFSAKRGQMMGSYLSFPLLCLQNYLAYRWVCQLTGSDVGPVLINGDDILFQCSPDFYPIWVSELRSVGLEVETSKTSVSRSYGTLNSTLVKWSSGQLRVRGTLKLKRFLPRTDLLSLAKDFEACVTRVGKIAYRVGCVFLRSHAMLLRSSRWNPLELGFRGALALRCLQVLGILQRHAVGWTSSPPSPPKGHNVSLPLDKFVEVPVEFVPSEIRDISASEVAAWKFSLDYSKVRSGEIQYCLELSRPQSWVYPIVPREIEVLPTVNRIANAGLGWLSSLWLSANRVAARPVPPLTPLSGRAELRLWSRYERHSPTVKSCFVPVSLLEQQYELSLSWALPVYSV